MIFDKLSTPDKYAAVKRIAMARGLSGILPAYVVNEFPKSGGTWVAQLLSEALEVPFPRNSIPPLQPCILHGHYLKSFGIRNAVIVWRDGRDVYTSYYFHCFFRNDLGNAPLVAYMKRKFPFKDYSAVADNMPTFIDVMFRNPGKPSFTWTDFAARWWARSDVAHVKYEDLRKDTARELRRLVNELRGVDLSEGRLSEITSKFDFNQQKVTAAESRDTTSFLRRGVPGDWKNYFTSEATAVFESHAGEWLKTMGYVAMDRSSAK